VIFPVASVFSKPLYFYGIFLWVIGLVGYLSNPEKAATALISGGVFGSISILLGVFSGRAPRLFFKLAAAVVAFLLFVFSWRTFVSWQAVLNGQAEKMVAAVLISSMLVASVLTLLLLVSKKKQLGA